MKAAWRAWILAAACLLAAAFLAGCSSNPPQISRVFARVTYSEDAQGARRETLGVYLVATDPDGLENLSAFYVINDDAELFWKVDAAAWTSTTAEGETWIGSSSLDMPGGGSLPAGAYRVVLQNEAGDTAEDSFTLPDRTESASKAAFPSATVAGDLIKVASPYGGAEVWAYGKDGKFVASFPSGGKAPPMTVSGAAVSNPALASGFTFRVFAWNERGGYGVLSRPYQAGAASR